MRPPMLMLAIAAAGALPFSWLPNRQEEPDSRIRRLAVSGSGRWIAAGTAKGRVTIWDRRQLRQPRSIQAPHGILNDLQFSPDEESLIIANRRLEVVSVRKPEERRFLRVDDRN